MNKLNTNAQLLQADVSNRYFFKTSDTDGYNCIERCLFKDNGTMIGSLNCQNCSNCLDHNHSEDNFSPVDWIVCSKIKMATGQ